MSGKDGVCSPVGSVLAVYRDFVRQRLACDEHRENTRRRERRGEQEQMSVTVDEIEDQDVDEPGGIPHCVTPGAPS